MVLMASLPLEVNVLNQVSTLCGAFCHDLGVLAMGTTQTLVPTNQPFFGPAWYAMFYLVHGLHIYVCGSCVMVC